jgi:hypothetical protein
VNTDDSAQLLTPKHAKKLSKNGGRNVMEYEEYIIPRAKLVVE